MLPITRVVLFKHGVGFFGREGTVDGNQSIGLGFKAEQMNDVLKSLTALDFDGGTFAALTYDSEEPLERRLGEINLDIPEGGAITAFIDQLKGARVAIPRGERRLEGVVVGIEEANRQLGEQVVVDRQLAILADGCRLVRVPLDEVEEVEFLDESVRRELKMLLDIHFSGLRKDRKRLTIQARGTGERKVALSYVVEAPVWKTSYRIVLPGESDDAPLMQGWALVDNTTEDDWTGVNLSLVAGLPISFVHDLYAPRYRRRPIVEVDLEEVVAPPLVEAAGFDMLGGGAASMAAPSRSRKRAAMAPGAPPPPPSPKPAAGPSSVQVHTRTQEVGDLFAYEITQPVDIGRGCSALVPILQAEAKMDRVAIYNQQVREKNPMTAFRIKNTTGLTLEGGPVTVFEAGSYVGEAMLDTMRKDEERITPYSVELGVRAKVESRHERKAYTRLTKRGAYLYKFYEQLLVTTYTFTSQLERGVDLYVDHRFSHATRRDTPEPVEVTEHFWRFRLDLPARQAQSLVVQEVSEQYESISVHNLASETVHDLVTGRLIDDERRMGLQRIADEVAAIGKRQQTLTRMQAEIERVEKGQERIRDNIKALGQSTEEARLRQRYVATLAQEEEQLEQGRRQVRQLTTEIDGAKVFLEKLIDSFEITE